MADCASTAITNTSGGLSGLCSEHGFRYTPRLLLDENDMICDYKALKMLFVDLVDRLNHAMALNSEEARRSRRRASSSEYPTCSVEDRAS
ncbi:MAG: hypothetical protein GY906_00405 [bacterium]|nr:hypothetical protein [bacterium]